MGLEKRKRITDSSEKREISFPGNSGGEKREVLLVVHKGRGAWIWNKGGLRTAREAQTEGKEVLAKG